MSNLKQRNSALKNRSLIIQLHDSVARQHALFLRLLPDKLQDSITVMYLLFRMLDTIEDSELNDIKRAILLDKASNDFIGALKEAKSLVLSSNRVEKSYQMLFENSDSIFKFHRSLEPEIQQEIEMTGMKMAGGMNKFFQKFIAAKQNGAACFLESLSELEEYCYFAAGCVGELNTRMFRYRGYIKDQNFNEMLIEGKSLGIYLQLVNVLRDLAEDLRKKQKSYMPKELTDKNPSERIRSIIQLARKHELEIKKYLSNLDNNSVKDYCSTLFKVGKAHYDYFEDAPEEIIKGNRVPTSKIFFALPWKLRYQFAIFNLKKVFCSIHH